MSTVYVPVPTILPATATLPQDLVDQRSAASVNVPFKTALDAIAYLMQSSTHNAGRGLSNPIGYTDEIAKTHNISALDLTPITTGAVIDDTGMAIKTKFVTTNITSALARHVVWDITSLLIHGGTFVSAVVKMKGDPGGHALLPLLMPAIGVVRWAPATALVCLRAAGMFDDQSANVAEFDAIHDTTFVVDQNATIDLKLYSYFLIACNEGNTNSREGFEYHNMHVAITAPRYRA